MKREELKQIAELTDEQLDKIMAINGADVEKVKAKVTALEADLKEAKETIDKTNTEFEALKSSNAGAEEYKTKYEALVAENEAKAKAKSNAERQARIENNSKKIEKIKNAQVLGIKLEDGTTYSLVKYFNTESVEDGTIRVYNIATKGYYVVSVDSIEIIA